MVRLVQITHRNAGRRVGLVDEPQLRLLSSCDSVYELAQLAIESQRSIVAVVQSLISDERLPYDDVYLGQSDWRLLPPIDHPEPSRCFVTGTGLTHKGSAENRQSMHVATDGQQPVSDSMKMFQIGLEGGRPRAGCLGAAPEWFYKGVRS